METPPARGAPRCRRSTFFARKMYDDLRGVPDEPVAEIVQGGEQLSQKQQHLALVLRVASGARFFRAIA